MDDVGQVGLLAPPEDPQLLGLGLDLAAPHAEQVGLNAAHEAAQHRVVLGRGRDHGTVLPAAAEAVATPFNARQLRLAEEEKHSSFPSKEANIKGDSTNSMIPAEKCILKDIADTVRRARQSWCNQ